MLNKVDGVIAELIRKNEELKVVQQKASEDVVNVLRDFIKSTPEIEAIRWSQYTPYFNDGDVCEFSVNGLEIKFSDDVTDILFPSELRDHPEDKFLSLDWEIPGLLEKNADVLNIDKIKVVKTALDAVCKLQETLYTIEDALQTRFGDHTQVTVSKSGIDTENYEHE